MIDRYGVILGFCVCLGCQSTATVPAAEPRPAAPAAIDKAPGVSSSTENTGATARAGVAASIVIGTKVGDCGIHDQVPVYEVFRGSPLSADPTNSLAYLPVPNFPVGAPHLDGAVLSIPISEGFDAAACGVKLGVPAARLQRAEMRGFSYMLRVPGAGIDSRPLSSDTGIGGSLPSTLTFYFQDEARAQIAQRAVRAGDAAIVSRFELPFAVFNVDVGQSCAVASRIIGKLEQTLEQDAKVQRDVGLPAFMIPRSTMDTLAKGAIAVRRCFNAKDTSAQVIDYGEYIKFVERNFGGNISEALGNIISATYDFHQNYNDKAAQQRYDDAKQHLSGTASVPILSGVGELSGVLGLDFQQAVASQRESFLDTFSGFSQKGNLWVPNKVRVVNIRNFIDRQDSAWQNLIAEAGRSESKAIALTTFEQSAVCPSGCTRCIRGTCAQCSKTAAEMRALRIANRGRGFELTCSGMRPSTGVEIHAIGGVRTDPSNGDDWIGLQVTGDIGTKLPAYFETAHGSPLPFDLSNHVVTDTSGRVSTHLEATRCASFRGDSICVFDSNFTIAISDPSLE